MVKNAKHYGKLVKLQGLIKARDQIELADKQKEQAMLKQEDAFLFNMMDNVDSIDIYGPMLLQKRLQRNAKLEAILDNTIDDLTKKSLQSSRREDAFINKQKKAKSREERQEISKMLEEYIASKIAKDTSLA